MSANPTFTAKALLQSLVCGPRLVGDLPEAKAFPSEHLTIPPEIPPLNFEQKLGHLYEDALAILLQFSPKIDFLAQNLQIQKDIHTTVGELDFLIRDCSSNGLIHLELATKFYLAFQSEDGLKLPGPDARDNYFRKITRLRDHQLQLPTRYRDHLPELYRDQTIITQQLIYGCLFDHIDSPEQANPDFINPNCRRGKWLYQNEIPRHFTETDHFQIIPKPLWPVPLEFLQNLTLATWDPNQRQERCLMVRYKNKATPYFLAPNPYGPI